MNRVTRSPVRNRRQFLTTTIETAAASSFGSLITRGAGLPYTPHARTPHAATQPAARSDEKWWVQRQKRINLRLSEGNVDAVIIGDSITEGWEHHHGIAVWDAFYGHRRIVNLGFGGDQTQHVLWRLDHSDFSKMAPKVAFVMIGTNNLGAGHSVPQIVDGILALVERLRQKLPNARIVMHGILCREPNPNDAGRQQAAAVNQALVTLAVPHGFEMLDLAVSFRRSGYDTRSRTYVSPPDAPIHAGVLRGRSTYPVLRYSGKVDGTNRFGDAGRTCAHREFESLGDDISCRQEAA